MPVHRAHFRRRAGRQTMRWAKQNPRESQHATKQMQAVRSRENVKEAAARIRGKEKSCGSELLPSDSLADQKEDSENRRDAPPVPESLLVVGFEKFARVNQRETARDENCRVEPEN